MERTPQSFDSRLSPQTRSSRTSECRFHYPSPAQSDSASSHQIDLRGLGLYDYSNSSSNNQGGFSTHTAEVNELPQTPSTMYQADYDPFAPYQASFSNSTAYNMQREDLTGLATSPANSCSLSQRSSFSSAAASTAYSHSEVGHVKTENHMEWPSESHLPAIHHGGEFQNSHSLGLPMGYQEGRTLQPTTQSSGFASPYYGSPSPLSWSKVGSNAGNSTDMEAMDARSSGQKVSDAGRLRQPRKLTTKEEANFQCTVKGCGKLFGRSYNYKAHMETHDASRVYPFPCPLDGCTRRFVRKTDLQRHNQSVHMKQRDFKCDYCSRYFARKDTLRRHMEDGCSKRFDIGTLDISQDHYRPPQMNPEAEWQGGMASRSPMPFTSTTVTPGQHAHSSTAFSSHNHQHNNMPVTSNGQTSVWSR